MVDHKFVGGINLGHSKWDCINYSFPLATWTIRTESLLLATPFKEYNLSRSEVKAIIPYKGMFSKGYKIEHNADKLPPFVVFWTFWPQELREVLSNLGYSVEHGLAVE